jgi:hypothetical protein
MTKTFHIRFKVTSYDYNKLCNDLTHLIIDFLVASDIIPFSDLSHYYNVTINFSETYCEHVSHACYN